MAERARAAGRPRRRFWAAAVWLAACLAALAAIAAAGADGLVSADGLAGIDRAVRAAVTERPVASCVLFVLLLAAALVVALPSIVLFGTAGGYVFGAALATPLVLAGAMLGAALVLVIGRTAFGTRLLARRRGALGRLAREAARTPWSTVLFLRLVPLIPSWTANLLPLLVPLRLDVYFAASVAGLIPPVVAVTVTGEGLRTVAAAGMPFDATVLSLGLGLLALLCLVPVGLRALGRRRPVPAAF